MFECHLRAMLRLTVCLIAGQIVPEASRSILLDYQDRNPKSVIEIVPEGKQGCHVQVDLTSHTSHDHQATPLIDASPADRGPTSQTTSLLSSKKGNPSIPVSPTRQYLNPLWCEPSSLHLADNLVVIRRTPESGFSWVAPLIPPDQSHLSSPLFRWSFCEMGYGRPTRSSLTR